MSLQSLSHHTNLIKLAAIGILSQSHKDGANEENNRNLARGSPTKILFIFNLFGQRGISCTNWREQPEFCKGFPPPFFLSLYWTSIYICYGLSLETIQECPVFRWQLPVNYNVFNVLLASYSYSDRPGGLSSPSI